MRRKITTGRPVGITMHTPRRALSMTATVTVTLSIALTIAGCYSFRGGSAPAHLDTVVIPEVIDNSGSGRGTLRFDVTNRLIDRFRQDNSLRVIDDESADSRLEVAITLVRTDIRQGVSAADRETLRGVSIEAQATFFDNVKDRAIYERRRFAGTSTYDLAEGAAGEEEAIDEAVNLLTNEILLGTVAEW